LICQCSQAWDSAQGTGQCTCDAHCCVSHCFLPATGLMWPAASSLAAKNVDPPAKTPCRICHTLEETRADPLVAPCLCDGSMRYVHNSCQQAWLRARHGPLEYRCELCCTSLSHRLTMATRFELAAVSTTSATLWVTQLSSALRMARLVAQLIAIGWRRVEGHSGASRFLAGSLLLRRSLRRDATAEDITRGPLRPSPTSETVVAACDELAHSAAIHFVLTSIIVIGACAGLSLLRRPLAILGEEAMMRFCIIKIGGCVLALLHEMLLIFPPAQRVAPLSAWHVIGTSLLLDTLLLAFLRIPRRERRSRLVLHRVTHAACRLTTDFLPFAAVFFLWSASIFVILAASLVPCVVLLFREVIHDIRRRRHQHGSIQMVLFITRLVLRVVSLIPLGFRTQGVEDGVGTADMSTPGATSTGRSCEWLSNALVLAWFATEVAIVMDLSVYRIGACCAAEGLSQAMWSIAVAGQAALALHGHYSARSRNFEPAVWLPGASAAGSGMSMRLSFPSGVEDAALVLSIVCFLWIHMPVFFERAWRLREVLVHTFTQIEPGQVVFCDRQIPSPTLRARTFWRRWLLIRLWR